MSKDIIGEDIEKVINPSFKGDYQDRLSQLVAFVGDARCVKQGRPGKEFYDKAIYLCVQHFKKEIMEE